MTRRSRCIQPALDELDRRTLLTAGPLALLAGDAPGVIDVKKQGFYNFIYVKTSGFTATNVKWELFAPRQVGEDPVKIEQGTISRLDATPKLIKSEKTWPSSMPGVFEFKDRDGFRRGEGSSPGTTSNQPKPPPLITTYTLLPPK